MGRHRLALWQSVLLVVFPMDIRQLRYFIAIAEAPSLLAAAHRPGAAQLSLSQHGARIEIEPGMRLIDRSPRGRSDHARGDPRSGEAGHSARQIAALGAPDGGKRALIFPQGSKTCHLGAEYLEGLT